MYHWDVEKLYQAWIKKSYKTWKNGSEPRNPKVWDLNILLLQLHLPASKAMLQAQESPIFNISTNRNSKNFSAVFIYVFAVMGWTKAYCTCVGVQTLKRLRLLALFSWLETSWPRAASVRLKMMVLGKHIGKIRSGYMDFLVINLASWGPKFLEK